MKPEQVSACASGSNSSRSKLISQRGHLVVLMSNCAQLGSVNAWQRSGQGRRTLSREVSGVRSSSLELVVVPAVLVLQMLT